MSGSIRNKRKNWYNDKYQFVLVQRNILASITFLSLFAALVAVYAVKSLAPLKTVEPFIIQVDKKSGVTEVIEPEEFAGTKKLSEVINNYFIWKYILSRESYSVFDLNQKQNIVRILSDPQSYDEYRRYINPSTNASSPRAILGAKGSRVLKDPTVVYLNEPHRSVVQVRFTMEQKKDRTITTLPKIATIEYGYFNLELTRKERLINPLGFQVIGYRLDEETLK